MNFEFLQASTYQMAVLLQFNTVKRLTMQQLEESSQLKSVRIFCHLIDIGTSSIIVYTSYMNLFDMLCIIL